ncbi:MAG: hypothetical protein ACREU6_04035, partial [Steroidobacteraceae bacterium]
MFQQMPTDGTAANELERKIGIFESQRIVASFGKYLFKRYWGRYVAFLRDATGVSQSIVRDPAGHLPCQYMNYQGVLIIFSSIANLEHILPMDFAVNWSFVEAWILNPFIHCPQTGLEGVFELCAGHCLNVSQNTSSTYQLW